MWLVTCDTWHMTCYMSHMTHRGRWPLCQNFRSLALTVWELWCSEDISTKDEWLNELITEVFVEQPRLHWVCWIQVRNLTLLIACWQRKYFSRNFLVMHYFNLLTSVLTGFLCLIKYRAAKQILQFVGDLSKLGGYFSPYQLSQWGEKI